MESYIIFSILSVLFWPLSIGLILYFLFRKRKNGSAKINNPFFSKEDLISQLLILLSLALMWVFFLSVDKQLGNPIAWKTVLLISTIITFAISYYFKVLFALPFALISSAIWWGMQSFETNRLIGSESVTTFTGILLFALLSYCIGRFHELWPKWKRYSLVYVVLSLFTITSSLFFISTRAGLSFLNTSSRGPLGSGFTIFFLILFSFLILFAVLYSLYHNLIGQFDSVFIFILLILFGALNFIPANSLFSFGMSTYSYYSSSKLSTFGYLVAFTFNVLLLSELLVLIFLGYIRKESWLITIGSIFIFIFIFVKYIDWFFTFMDKSLFFVGAGLLLFGVGGLMERARKKMILSMNSNQQIENF